VKFPIIYSIHLIKYRERGLAPSGSISKCLVVTLEQFTSKDIAIGKISWKWSRKEQ
jgi:hypothetical protein